MKIEIENLTKKYGDKNAIDNVSILLETGHIYGLIGENGAGKSTLIKGISNYILVDNGSVLVDGMNSFENEKALDKIAVMGDYVKYYPATKLEKLLKNALIFNKRFDLEYSMCLAKKFGLDLNKKVTALSTGYLSIFKFIMAVCSGKEYIFLDEPILGLDANHRDMVYKVIVEVFGKYECSIIISTHLIEEISNVLDEVIFIQDGKITISGDKEALLARSFVASGACVDVENFVKNKEVIKKEVFNGMATCYYFDDEKDCCNGVEIAHATLQNLFISMCRKGDFSDATN